MVFLQIFGSLIWLWLPLLIIYLVIRYNKKKPDSDYTYGNNPQVGGLNEQWLAYLRSFQGVVKSAAEKKLLETLIIGRSADDLYKELNDDTVPAPSALPVAAVQASTAQTPTVFEEVPTPYAETQAQTPVKQSTPIDNTILLLYFGAFLLVASVGLFVAISGLSGVMRTIIVALTAAILYSGGLWLYKNNKKLEQAGISFVGTGMIITPLIGVAWFNLVSMGANAGVIWSLTSILCITLYAHAYSQIKNDFISYLLIGSFVSSVESAVLTIDLPSYGYAWGLVAAGLLLSVTNRRAQKSSGQLQAASAASSQLLIPLSVVGSMVLIPEFGSFQLAVTLVLAGVYYSLLALWQAEQRTSFSLAAQVSYIAAIANIVYASDHNFNTTGLALLGIGVLYAAALSVLRLPTIRMHNLKSVAILVNSAAALLCIGDAWSFISSAFLAIGLSIILWRRFESASALQIGSLILLPLPFIVGLAALDLNVTSWAQLGLCASSALLLGLLTAACCIEKSSKPHYETSAVFYFMAIGLLFIPAWGLGYESVGLVTAGAFASFMALRWLSKDADWLVGMSFILLVPVVHAMAFYDIDSPQFSATLGVALLGNIILSLMTRHAVIRYVVVGCILLAPLALGGGGLGFKWDSTGYAGGYMLAMASCVLARTIARGKLLLSSKVPISSYYAEASEAYVLGYTVAGVIALLISFYADNSQLVTSLVLGAIGIFVVIIAKIERSPQLYALLPIILQALLFSAIRPDLGDATTTGVMALVSVFAAVCSYAAVTLIDPSHENKVSRSVNLVSVFSAYIGPMLVMTQDHPSLLLPVSLFIAGLVTLAYNYRSTQGVKEVSIAVSLAAIHWFIYLLGVTNIHIHTHILAVFLASFAVWRSSLNDSSAAQSYTQALFFVVSIPLALQAMGGENGSTYGLILIAEQVAFMVYGASFGQRFLLRWGLWTALAAILFQLRGLGWAFLSLLALIVIGVAVYRLQKHTPPDAK